MREEVGEHGDRRHRNGGGQRELPVHGRQDDRRADQHQHALDRLHHAPADEVAHGVDVVGRPRDDLAGRVPVVEGARVAQVRVVQLRPQPGLDGHPDARGRVAPREVDPEPQRRDGDDRPEVRDEQRAVAAVDRVVDRALDEDRDEERQDREDDGARQADRGQPPLGPPERVQVPDRRPESEVGRVDVRHRWFLPGARGRASGPIGWPPREAPWGGRRPTGARREPDGPTVDDGADGAGAVYRPRAPSVVTSRRSHSGP